MSPLSSVPGNISILNTSSPTHSQTNTQPKMSSWRSLTANFNITTLECQCSKERFFLSMIWFLKIFAVLSMSLARISNRNLLIWTIFEKWSGTAVWIFWRFMDPSEVGSEWKFGDIVPNRIAWSTLYSVTPPHSTFSTRKYNKLHWKCLITINIEYLEFLGNAACCAMSCISFNCWVVTQHNG